MTTTRAKSARVQITIRLKILELNMAMLESDFGELQAEDALAMVLDKSTPGHRSRRSRVTPWGSYPSSAERIFPASSSAPASSPGLQPSPRPRPPILGMMWKWTCITTCPAADPLFWSTL